MASKRKPREETPHKTAATTVPLKVDYKVLRRQQPELRKLVGDSAQCRQCNTAAWRAMYKQLKQLLVK
eukprot:1142617-Pelagomonas_calceolata.AAC.2